MAIEIERKFLVTSTAHLHPAQGFALRQGYVCITPGAVARVRVRGAQAFLTIKGKTQGISRSEFEYPIPVADAQQMLDELCPSVVSKTRFLVEHAGHTWEVDVFDGENEGLVVAEIELDAPDENFERPEWVGQEVSDDVRYFNAYLSQHPYTSW